MAFSNVFDSGGRFCADEAGRPALREFAKHGTRFCSFAIRPASAANQFLLITGIIVRLLIPEARR